MNGMQINYKIPKVITRDLPRMPDVFRRHMSRGVHRAALEVGREERRAAPKAFSTLANSIKESRIGEFAWAVSPSAEHADYMEQGTRPGAFPPPESIMAWLEVKRITPNDDSTSMRSLAFLIGRSIQRKGIRKQPFAAPTAEKMEPRVYQILRQSAAAGLREMRLA